MSAIGNRLDRGPDAHLIGDIECKAHKVAIAGAAVLKLDPGAIAEFQGDRLDRVDVQPGDPPVDEGIRCLLSQIQAAAAAMLQTLLARQSRAAAKEA